MNTLRQSLSSIVYFAKLASSRSLHISNQHLHNKITASDGKTYEVFRETFSDRDYGKEEVTLIIGFRLKFINKNKFFHRLFLSLCILDTPIWVGFKGFKVKYWMVSPKTKDYLGLYGYQGKENAKKYAEYISSVLKPVSTANSVWYHIENVNFERYIENHKK